MPIRVTLLIAILCGACAADMAQPSPNDVAKIKQLETKYYADFNAGRFDDVLALETDDFVIADEGKSFTKAQQSAEMHAKDTKPLNGTVVMTNHYFQHYGNVVIVTADTDLSSSTDKEHRGGVVTEVWVEKNGTLKLASLSVSMRAAGS
jgi:ketosteroid isomerase-like protein